MANANARSFNSSDPLDQAWASEVYKTAIRFIQEFLLMRVGFSAFVREVCEEFRQRNPDLCDDVIMRPGSSTQTEWRHRVDAALQSLKKQGIVTGGQDSTARGLWTLK